MNDKITAVIIAKNEEEMIGDCLRSLSFCDAIIVVDNSSSDNTVGIAKKVGAKIITVKSDNLSELRSAPLKKISTEYVLYIDADERVTKELADEILGTISSGADVVAFYLFRQNYYFGNHPWPKKERLERLFKTEALKGWRGILHESPIFFGATGEFKNPLLHYTHRNFSSMVTKTNDWSVKEAELRFQAHHPPMSWWRFPRVMIGAFFQSYITSQGYKAGMVGLLESIYQAFSMFVTYAKLWELQQREK